MNKTQSKLTSKNIDRFGKVAAVMAVVHLVTFCLEPSLLGASACCGFVLASVMAMLASAALEIPGEQR